MRDAGWMDGCGKCERTSCSDDEMGQSRTTFVPSDFSSFHILRPMRFPIDSAGCVLFAGDFPHTKGSCTYEWPLRARAFFSFPLDYFECGATWQGTLVPPSDRHTDSGWMPSPAMLLLFFLFRLLLLFFNSFIWSRVASHTHWNPIPFFLTDCIRRNRTWERKAICLVFRTSLPTRRARRHNLRTDFFYSSFFFCRAYTSFFLAFAGIWNRRA